jgi:hypothetical protein
MTSTSGAGLASTVFMENVSGNFASWRKFEKEEISALLPNHRHVFGTVSAER